MARLANATVAVVVLVFALLASAAVAGQAGKRPPGHRSAVSGSFKRVHFVDHAKGSPGPPQATAAATNFHVSNHPLGQSLTYAISTTGCSSPCGGGNAASSVATGFSDWSVSGLTVTQSASAATNPCTNQPNSVSWSAIDGAGGILAGTSVCVNLVNRRIVGFQTIFDSGDRWSSCDSVDSCAGVPSGVFSIAAVAAHESGHVFGLEHDHAPKDARLTMFFGIAPNDYGLATLGCGDRLGVNALYGTSLDCSSVPLD
jgi:hypothetical protein